MDSKMKKMAELQLSVVSDPKNRKAIENQVQMTYECLLPLLTSLAANSDVGAGSYTSGGNSFCGLLVVQLCETLWTVVCQAPLSMAFSRQEYWIGLPCPPPGDLPNPGIKPMSL